MIFQLGMYIALMLAFVVQVTLIFPVEQYVVGSGVVNLVSLLFIPFGFKVIFAAFGGASAILPIFFAHATMDLYFGKSLSDVLLHAGIGVFIVYLPLVLMNFSRERPLLANLDLAQGNINIARVILVLAFIATILNSIIHSTLYQGVQIDLLAFRYVTGDLGGTIFVLLVLVLLKRQLIGISHRMLK